MNQGEEQYAFVRSLAQCGHLYATLSEYDQKYRIACEKVLSAGTDQEADSWAYACEAISALGMILFGQKWQETRLQVREDATLTQNSLTSK